MIKFFKQLFCRHSFTFERGHSGGFHDSTSFDIIPHEENCDKCGKLVTLIKKKKDGRDTKKNKT